MKALILNSGLGSRMNNLTSNMPKCMVNINDDYTILQRQLELLIKYDIKNIIITTGYKKDVLTNYINNNLKNLLLGVNLTLVHNDLYEDTNYIYSMYLANKYLDDDIILLHGDVVFEEKVLAELLRNDSSKMIVSSSVPLPKKDFKARIFDDKIVEISIDCFDNSLAAEPFYLYKMKDFKIWMNEIINFINIGNNKVYAENAFNSVSQAIDLKPLDIKDSLCMEVDCLDDLNIVKNKLERKV